MNIVTKFLTFLNQVKILHWQTVSYAEHKTLDGIYESLEDNIDEFIETFMGKYGRIVSASTFNLSLQNYSSLPPMELMNQISAYLIDELPGLLDPKKDTDLLNIRDTILGNVNQTKYLLTLK